MSVKMANPVHEVAYQELTALVARHSADMSPLDILAIAANMVGKIVAMQDQRVTTPEVAMETVARNLEYGNAQVLEEQIDRCGMIENCFAKAERQEST